MGSMKEYMQDLEAERFDEWLEENYSPDVTPTLKNGGAGREPVLLGAGSAGRSGSVGT